MIDGPISWQVRRDVFHQRAACESIERGRRVRPAERAWVALLDDGVDQAPRLVEVADAHEVVGMCHDRVGDVAPARRVGFDAQEVGQE